MADLLLDTDVVIDHLRSHRMLAVPDRLTAYSSLTRAELYAGQRVDEAGLDLLLDRFIEIPVDRSIAEEGGKIKRIHDVGLADAIIAATALITNRTLVTRNGRDFGRIPGLKIIKP